MQTILTVIQVFLSLGIIGLVLIQHGRGADAGAAFGSGASATVFGARGSGSFLSRVTGILAALFFLTSMALAYYAAQGGKPAGLMDDVDPGAPAARVEIPAADAPAVPVPAPREPASDVPGVPGVPAADGSSGVAGGGDVPAVPLPQAGGPGGQASAPSAPQTEAPPAPPVAPQQPQASPEAPK